MRRRREWVRSLVVCSSLASVQALKEGVQEDGELEPQARWSVTRDHTLMYESTT